jgi:hypothetical protein
MRPAVDWLDTSTLSWDVGVGVATKVLNTDPVSGARTVLLRSDPRPVTEATRRRAHFHDGTEEFFSLGPRFTFDNGIWLDRGAYVHVPPRTVHGTDVQVPDGYLLYLRTSGGTRPQFVDAAPGEMTVTAAPQPGRLFDPIRRAAAAGVVIGIVQLPPGFEGLVPGLPAFGMVEMFVMDGVLTGNPGRTLGAGGYLCLPAAALAVPVASSFGARILLTTEGVDQG